MPFEKARGSSSGFSDFGTVPGVPKEGVIPYFGKKSAPCRISSGGDVSLLQVLLDVVGSSLRIVGNGDGDVHIVGSSKLCAPLFRDCNVARRAEKLVSAPIATRRLLSKVRYSSAAAESEL